MSGDIRLVTGRHDRVLIITRPGALNGHLQLRLPEFHGISDGTPFAIEQALRWEIDKSNPALAHFEIEGLPSEVGIDFHGHASLATEDQIQFEMTVKNEQDAAIHEAFQTVFVDLENAPDFHEANGENAFLYTNEGWISIAEIQSSMEVPAATIMVDKEYGAVVGISRLLARQTHKQDGVVACACPEAIALASNHPDWPEGILLSCLWGTLQAGAEKTISGTVFLLEGGLTSLQDRYAQTVQS